MEALDRLGINLGLLVAYTANVVLLLVLLRAVAFKPITEMLEKRRERISAGLQKERLAEEALANAESEKQAELDKARAEAQQIINEARTRAKETESQLVSEAQDQARRIVERAEEEAAAERNMALSEMREQIVSLSLAAASHLLGSEIDAKAAKATVTDFFTNIPAEAKGMGDSYTVVTAVPLTDAEQGKVTKDLGTDAVTFVTDPGILGGVIVRSGASEFDASYANQLSQMRVAMQ